MRFSRYSLSVDMPRLWVLVMVLGLRFVSGSLPHRHLSVVVDRRGRFYSFHTLPSLLSLPLARLWRASGGAAASISPLFLQRASPASPSLPFSLAPFSAAAAAASQICTVNHFPSAISDRSRC